MISSNLTQKAAHHIMFTENFEKHLYTKRELKFNKDGKFKILMMSDIQEPLNIDERTIPAINKLIDKVKPDFIILGGDNCDHNSVSDKEKLKAYLDTVTYPMESRKIPWAHVFGNHDHDIELDDVEKTMLYENYPYCISKHSEGIFGTTNYILPVKRSDSDDIAFNIWAIDTGDLITDSNIKIPEDRFAFNRPVNSDAWDIIHFDQQMWYYLNSVEFEKRFGKKIPGFMFQHIALWEFQMIVDNMEKLNACGCTEERMGLGYFNSGMFSVIAERGDILSLASGHSHIDDFSGKFAGIQLSLDGSAGYSPYGKDETRGGRVFEIDENDIENFRTYMVHYKDL